MSKRGENIYKRKDGRWEARYQKGYTENGSIRYGYCYAKTYREAKEKAQKAKGMFVLGIDTEKSAAKKSLSVFCDEWLQLKRSKVKEATLVKYTTNIENHITPPKFETNAVSGVPKSPGESWTEIYQDGMSFSAHVCGEFKINDSSADIYFTNDSENLVWMKLRITDEKGNILGETGLLKPNQYVKSVCLDVLPETGQKIKMKIMSYEPNTYYSAGSVTLNTVVG